MSTDNLPKSIHTPMSWDILCQRVLELAEEKEALEQKLAVAVEAAELGLSFAPKGPIPKDLAPMFYHTLNYSDEVALQERIDKARETLALINADRGEK